MNCATNDNSSSTTIHPWVGFIVRFQTFLPKKIKFMFNHKNYLLNSFVRLSFPPNKPRDTRIHFFIPNGDKVFVGAAILFVQFVCLFNFDTTAKRRWGWLYEDWGGEPSWKNKIFCDRNLSFIWKLFNYAKSSRIKINLNSKLISRQILSTGSMIKFSSHLRMKFKKTNSIVSFMPFFISHFSTQHSMTLITKDWFIKM